MKRHIAKWIIPDVWAAGSGLQNPWALVCCPSGLLLDDLLDVGSPLLPVVETVTGFWLNVMVPRKGKKYVFPSTHHTINYC